MSVFEFVEREKVNHSVVRLCHVLGVSPSGYWAWRKRAPSARARADAQLTGQIRAIHQASRGDTRDLLRRGLGIERDQQLRLVG